MARLYLDWNATSPLRAEARAALARTLDAPPGNPGSVHAHGHRARMEMERARDAVAALVGAGPQEIVFTGGGTESNNLALYGAALGAPARARRLVASAFEHPSVLAVLDDLEARGLEVVRVRPNGLGHVAPEAILEAAAPGTTLLVSLMLANNEIGTLQPVAEVGPELRRRGILFHCDAVQAAGRVPIDVATLGVDLLSIAAHKIGGLPGAGALYVRPGLTLAPHLRGGGQELNRRPGTENVPAIAAFGAAAEAAASGLAAEAARMRTLQARLEEGIAARGLDGRVNGDGAKRLPNTSSLFFPGTTGEALVIALDLEGAAVSAGAACSAGTLRRSPALLAMGRAEEAGASIRVSYGATTTEAEIDLFLEALGRVLARVRAAAVAR
jgi:cysteine desulfurase